MNSSEAQEPAYSPLGDGRITELLDVSSSGSADDSDTSGSQGFENPTSDTMDMPYDKRTSRQETNTFEVEFEPRAYSKMILHTAKYPHCAVTGLLLASGGRKSSGQIVLTDCIPLFHQSEGLTPMVEVALAQVEARCARGGQHHIAGFYHANRSMKDSSQVDIFSQRIADKIAENCVGGRAVLVTVDNRKLSLILESHALIVQQWSSSTGAASITERGNLDVIGGSGKWRHCATKNVGVSEETLALTSDLVGRKVYKEVADFDNHLDDITQDYLNVQMNMVIDQSL